MFRKAAIVLPAVMLAIGWSLPAPAQEAAETAVILSGSGGQARAAHSLGSAIGGAMNGAAAQVRGAGTAPRQAEVHRRDGRAVRVSGGRLPRGDALTGTDAPAYQLGSGASISVSGGGFIPGAGTSCVRNCEAAAASPRSRQ